MSAELKSILDLLGLPGAFGGTLLVLSLILALAPYFAGLDFGVIKVPDFSPEWRRRLKWLGPFTLVFMIFIHIPLHAPGVEPVPSTEIVGKGIVPGEAETGHSPDPEGAPPTQPKVPQKKPYNEADEELGQNKIEAEIVEKVISGVPKQIELLTTFSKHGETTLVGLVTVEARTANFVPATYLLEWILSTSDGKSILLDSYRENEKYKFTQRSDALITLYWVNKTIWADNLGTYVFRVYTGDYELVANAKLEIE